MILSQLLSESLKTLLASLTTKTTAAATDMVMLANTNDGTPSGKMTLRNLQTELASFDERSDITDLDLEAGAAGRHYTLFFVATATPPANVPSELLNNQRFYLLVFNAGGYYIKQFVFGSDGKIFYRQKNISTWESWMRLSTDTPLFYNSYASLAALATGIMGQNISSITAAYFQGTIAQAVFDNVFIAVTRLSDNYPLAVKPKDWSSYSSASAYHVDGVLLVSGDKHLVIAQTEANLRWGADADSHAASGNTATSDRDAAMATFDGKARTNTAVQVSEYSSAEVAPGYCHAFTTVTSAYDTTKTAYARRKAGMWWLPSLGEMMMIWSNMTKINQVMSLIGGTPLAETYYWTSTEDSQGYAWILRLSNGYVYGVNKKDTYRVRPVAAF